MSRIDAQANNVKEKAKDRPNSWLEILLTGHSRNNFQFQNQKDSCMLLAQFVLAKQTLEIWQIARSTATEHSKMRDFHSFDTLYTISLLKITWTLSPSSGSGNNTH